MGDDIKNLAASSPFTYVVHRQGLMTPDAFENHARKVSAWLELADEGRDAPYFGGDMHTIPERLSSAELAGAFRSETTAAAFRTSEIGIDPEALARLVRRRLEAEPGINCFTSREVLAVHQGERGLKVRSSQNGASEEEGYDFVLNTLWAGRLAIDAQLGFVPDQPWSFRFKYFVRALAKLPPVTSTTIVLGPFGDIVTYADGSIYLSWYPRGVTAWSKDLLPPDFPSHIEGPTAQNIRQGILAGLASVVPGVAELELRDIEIKGGWIFAWGDTDIDDPRSELHRRCAVGPRRHGRYVTVDTGKLTLAPLFAAHAVKLILG
jgi:hypothetical protein